MAFTLFEGMTSTGNEVRRTANCWNLTQAGVCVRSVIQDSGPRFARHNNGKSPTQIPYISHLSCARANTVSVTYFSMLKRPKIWFPLLYAGSVSRSTRGFKVGSCSEVRPHELWVCSWFVETGSLGSRFEVQGGPNFDPTFWILRFCGCVSRDTWVSTWLSRRVNLSVLLVNIVTL